MTARIDTNSRHGLDSQLESHSPAWVNVKSRNKDI